MSVPTCLMQPRLRIATPTRLAHSQHGASSSRHTHRPHGTLTRHMCAKYTAAASATQAPCACDIRVACVTHTYTRVDEWVNLSQRMNRLKRLLPAATNTAQHLPAPHLHNIAAACHSCCCMSEPYMCNTGFNLANTIHAPFPRNPKPATATQPSTTQQAPQQQARQCCIEHGCWVRNHAMPAQQPCLCLVMLV